MNRLTDFLLLLLFIPVAIISVVMNTLWFIGTKLGELLVTIIAFPFQLISRLFRK